MRLVLIFSLLLPALAHADRGPWYSRGAATAMLWTRAVAADSKGETPTAPVVRVDVAACAPKTGVVRGEKKAAWLVCLGKLLKTTKLDPQWVVMTADKLSSKQHQAFAKSFSASTRFAVTTHARGHLVIALGKPALRRAHPIVQGVLYDEANAPK